MASRSPDYAAAVERLQHAATFGINPSLEGIRALTEALGRPQDSMRFVQVTGTNGKTSVTRMIGAILTKAQRLTGIYTSPHLVSYTERIEIAGAPVSEAEFAEALGAVFKAADRLEAAFTEFELLTAAALWLFRQRKVEWGVLEVGMGGRWDATSVVTPAVAVITGVALDHLDRLGTTREQIAADKAHIIKEHSVVVLGPGCAGVEEVFERRAAEMHSPLIGRIGLGPNPDLTWKVLRRPRRPGGCLTMDVDVHAACRYRVSIQAPSYQAPNVATAMGAAGAALMEVGAPELLYDALKVMRFPGRFELLQEDPPLVIDGAHNPDAAAVLAAAIDEAFGENRPVIVIAVLADKDVEGIVSALAPVARSFVVTHNGSERCMAPGELARIVEAVTGHAPLVEPSLAEAVARALATGHSVVATGSLYTAGGVRKLRLG